MIVVSDSSPLINLAWIDRFSLIRDLFGSLLIPGAVWEEVVVHGNGQPGSTEVASADWIGTIAVANTDLVRALGKDLDAGEAEAVALAIEQSATMLLMDERLGRDFAQQLGLRTIGTIGILSAAKRSGLLDTIKPELDSLRNKAGFYITNSLYSRVLSDAGEG